MQTIEINATTTTVRRTIVSSLPPNDAADPRNFIAISEVSLQGTLGSMSARPNIRAGSLHTTE